MINLLSGYVELGRDPTNREIRILTEVTKTKSTKSFQGFAAEESISERISILDTLDHHSVRTNYGGLAHAADPTILDFVFPLLESTTYNAYC